MFTQTQVLTLGLAFMLGSWFSLSAQGELQTYRNPTIRQFQAEKLFLQGLEYYNNNELRRALGTFEEVVKLDPGHLTVYELRGETYYRLKQYDAAFSDYQQAAKLNPGNPKLRNDMGVAAARLGQYRAAIRYFTEALKLDPSYADAQQNLTLARQRLEAGGYPGTPVPGQVEPWLGTGGTTPTPGSQTGPLTGNPNGTGVGGDLNGLLINLDSLGNQSGGNRPLRPADQTIIYYGNRLNVGSQSDPYITLEKVVVTPVATELTFYLENPSNKDFPVQLGEPGKKEAWQIVDRSMQRHFPLTQLSSIFSTNPDQPYILGPGQRTQIIARFDRIADDMSMFHVIEGDKAFKGGWDFWEVSLKD